MCVYQIICTRGWKVILATLFNSFDFFLVCFQMCPEIACPRRGKVTLATFVWFFSTVSSQVCPQISCLRRGIVTLATFVWFFSTVRFQMCPQFICPGGCIVALAAFVWFFSTVRFQMCSKIPSVKGCIVTLVALLWPQNIVCLFHKDFHIYILYNWVIIFKRLFWLIPLCEFVCALYESFLQTEAVWRLYDEKWKWNWI